MSDYRPYLMQGFEASPNLLLADNLHWKQRGMNGWLGYRCEFIGSIKNLNYTGSDY